MGASEEGDEEGPEDPARLRRAACSKGSTTGTGAAVARGGGATGPDPDARGDAAPASDREAWSLARSDASYSRSAAASPEPSRHRLRPETASLEDPRERSIAATDAKGRRRGGGGLDLTKRRIGKRRRRKSAAEAGNPRKGGTEPFRTHIKPEPDRSGSPRGAEGREGRDWAGLGPRAMETRGGGIDHGTQRRDRHRPTRPSSSRRNLTHGPGHQRQPRSQI